MVSGMKVFFIEGNAICSSVQRVLNKAVGNILCQLISL